VETLSYIKTKRHNEIHVTDIPQPQLKSYGCILQQVWEVNKDFNSVKYEVLNSGAAKD
jgi:hypothetical protein